MKIAFADYTLDRETRQLLRDDREVHLSPKAFDLLCLLIERRPAVVPKTELYLRLWPATVVVEANLNVLIAEIRRALGDTSRAPRFVRTAHRVGYAFNATALDLTVPAVVPSLRSNRCWLAWNDQIFLLQAGENIVGRDPRCDVWVDATGVSRRHARIYVADESVTIEDLGSTNGTVLRQSTVTSPQRLRDLDVICIGASKIKFRMWSEELAPKTERLKPRARP
jgi:DNA-binding winged helix-turn-helix (wHTH) protein